MSIGILALLALMKPTFASDISTFQLLGENVKFYNYPKSRVTISKSCDSLKKDNTLCEDLKFLNEVSLSKAKLTGTGGINPSSVICKELLRGQVFVGTDIKQNENSFCRLPSGTFVDGGTITYYALKNDGVKQGSRFDRGFKKKGEAK